MPTPPGHHPRPARSRLRLRRAAVAAVAAALTGGLTQLPSPGYGAAGTTLSGDPAARVHTPGDPVAGLSDLDRRGTALPTAAQRQAASALHAQVRWNSYGTPSSILAVDGGLGRATSTDPVKAARAWLAAHRSLLGLSSAQVTGLTLVNDAKLSRSNAHAVLFRQSFGGVAPAIGSMVTVAVARGQILYVSSSLTRTTGTPATPVLSPVQGWRTAAASVGRPVALSSLGTASASKGWTRFAAPGFAQPQLARTRALALADGSVRPVVEANVVDTKGGSAFAYTVLVDAVSGKVLWRHNQVDNSSDAIPFSGDIDTTTGCGPKFAFETTDASTQRIEVAASTLPNVDIVLKLFGTHDESLSSSDTATSPEAIDYAPGGTLPKGVYHVQVCLYGDPTVPTAGPLTYAGTVLTSDTAGPETNLPFPPKWTYFLANPSLDYSTKTTPANRVTGCWVTDDHGTKVPGCSTPPGALENLAAAGPWDTFGGTGIPTFTTTGNAATTHEAWASPDSPGGTAQAPYSPERSYAPAFTDAWQNSGCDPTQLHPTGNDIDASVTNLFVAHNRMHDFSYYLGFTEKNYNLQQSNLGRNPDATRSNDPEVGNVQAGAVTGGTPSYLGRDNANQIALQDGVPGITNQYLFQPIAGAFYSPCADGSFDMSIVGHEYTHAISNRMIGGPDEGITSEQGGAMGESWGDLTAGEYLFEHGYPNGANPWAVGPYATGNKTVGIRDYAINHNPLNYSDYGYDSTGVEVHADGEIWNGTQWQVRQALVNKYDAAFPSTDKALQKACADGSATGAPLPTTRCPGNRRWIQLMFDAFLLQQGGTSMLDARDATLAADKARYGGANQKELWLAFARRGMGSDAHTPNADSGQPTPGFVAPHTASATVTFAPRVGGDVAHGTVFIGHYEARATPVADTLASTKSDATMKLAPGTYELVFAGKGLGLTRSTITVSAGEHVRKVITVEHNLASATSGAKVVGSSAGSLNTGSLIDDTEDTSWAGVNDTASVDSSSPYVVVNLAGGKHTLRTARVSAMLHPAPASATDVPLAADPDSGSRFTALRRFALDTCVASATNDCTKPDATWKRVFVSPADAFPAVRPRPVAPNLTLRSFRLPAGTVATHVRFVALENQCTGFAGYAGEQDSDPTNSTDCKADSDRDQSVRAAELELFD